MENELNKDDIQLTHVLISGKWKTLKNKFIWKYVTHIEILNNKYCLIIFGNVETKKHTVRLYKYKKI